MKIPQKFENGEIVYWCHQEGMRYTVHWGMVEESFSDKVWINYLHVKENRLINGIPIDEFPNESRKKKLPKGWTYDTKLFEITYEKIEEFECDIRDSEKIKQLYKDGLFVKYDAIFRGVVESNVEKDGYTIVKKYPPFFKIPVSHTTINPDRLHLTYDEAREEVNRNIAEYHRQANLSEYDWCVEQIDKKLDQWADFYAKTEKEKLLHRKWLLDMKNIEDLEVRIYNQDIQWKYFNKKRWNNIEL